MSGINVLLIGTVNTVSVNSTNQDVYAFTAAPGTATAQFEMKNNADMVKYENGISTNLGVWVIPPSASAGSFEVKATPTSGTVTGGTTGSWISLSSGASWDVVRSTVGIKSCTMTIEVRRTGTTLVIGSFSVTLTAETSL